MSASSAWSIDTRAVTRDAIGRYSLLVRRYCCRRLASRGLEAGGPLRIETPAGGGYGTT